MCLSGVPSRTSIRTAGQWPLPGRAGTGGWQGCCCRGQQVPNPAGGLLSPENGLDGKMKLKKLNYQHNQIMAVELGPLDRGWRGLGRELPFQLCSCEHLGVHVPALLPLPRQDKEAQFRHRLFFKASPGYRKDHLCGHWSTKVI